MIADNTTNLTILQQKSTPSINNQPEHIKNIAIFCLTLRGEWIWMNPHQITHLFSFFPKVLRGHPAFLGDQNSTNSTFVGCLKIPSHPRTFIQFRHLGGLRKMASKTRQKPPKTNNKPQGLRVWRSFFGVTNVEIFWVKWLQTFGFDWCGVCVWLVVKFVYPGNVTFLGFFSWMTL